MGLGTGDFPAATQRLLFLPAGPDARVGGLLPSAGRLQEEQAEVAGSGRAAGEGAGQRGERPGQEELMAHPARRGQRVPAPHTGQVWCGRATAALLLHSFWEHSMKCL